MLNNSEFIKTRLEILERHNKQIEEGLHVASVDQKFNDPIVRLIGAYLTTEKTVKQARLGIFSTLTVLTDPKDGNVKFLPYDLPSFKAYAKILDDGAKKLISLEDALSRLEHVEGIGFYADLQRVANAYKSKVNHLNGKLEQLGHSTRFEEAGIKQQIRLTREELSIATTELAKHQKVLDDIDLILAEIDASAVGTT